MINNISISNIFQQKNRNQKALGYLKKLGYPLHSVRKALVDLNGLKLGDISQGKLPNSSISRLISTKEHDPNRHARAKGIIADRLEVGVDELFHDCRN